MTLGEVMIASSVLLVCLTALAGVLGGSVTSSRSARARDEAANLANEKIEFARSLAYDQVGLHYANGAYGDPAGEIVTPEQVGSFTVVTECTWERTDAGRAAYKKLVVRVSWQQPMAGEVAVTTMIYGKSDISTSGDMVVRVRYRENALPVTNATVAIRTSTNADRSALTDGSGEAFFGQAAVGPVGITVVPPAGYVVDTSTISSATIAPDSLATLIVYVQQPAEATVRVSDTAGARIPGAMVELRRADGTVLPAVATDGNGDARITGLFYADYTATVTKDGYAASGVPFVVSAGAPAPVVPVSVSQTVGAGLRVRVFDVNGTQLGGATITLRRSSDNVTVQQAVAGTNGEYTFTLGAGGYNITVEKAAYATQVRHIELVGGVNQTSDFNLVPAVYKGNMRITTRDKVGHNRSIRVVVSGQGYYSDTNWSNYDGLLVLNDLVAGSYQVRCYTDPASTATVIVNGGQTAEVTIAQSK